MDLELGINGGGGGSNNDNNAAVVSMSADPAGSQMKELPPFTWLRAAPYILSVLAGVALCAVGVARTVSRPCSAAGADDDENKPAASNICDELGFALTIVGEVLVVFAAFMASSVLNFDCCVRRPRLDQAADD